MPAGSVTPAPASAVGMGDWRDGVTRAFVELGLEESDPVLREVAQAVTEMGLNESLPALAQSGEISRKPA